MYFDNFIDIHFSKLGVVFASFRDDVFEPGRVYSETNSIFSILLDQLDTKSGEKYVITEIKPGYKIVDGSSKQAIACWRVIFEDESIRYFTAETGEEIQN